MSNVIALAAVGGLGYYAYTQGWLGDALAQFQAPEVAALSAPDVVTPASVLTPASAPIVTNTSKEAQLLRDNMSFVSPWAARNLDWTAALMWQESRGNVSAMGPLIRSGLNKGDRAHGLMQVMPITAKHMHDIGNKELSTASTVLRTAHGSIYFGTAYLQFLHDQYGKSIEWMLHAYNGGPGFGNLTVGSSNYNQNQGYVKAIKARYAATTGVNA